MEKPLKNGIFWDEYYALKKGVDFPSPFAEFCLGNYIQKNSRVLELGCGNGRDAFYFSQNEISVLGLDSSSVAVTACNDRVMGTELMERLRFSVADFTEIERYYQEGMNIIYSRFSLHSVTEDAESSILLKTYEILPRNGLFLTEVRTILDELFRQGKKIGEKEFVTDHYRRFIESSEFLKKCLSMGWKVKYFTENRGLASYKNEDPTVARFVLMKK